MFENKSLLLQYLDKKMKAVHGNSKSRRNLANIYAIYAILLFYISDADVDRIIRDIDIFYRLEMNMELDH